MCAADYGRDLGFLRQMVLAGHWDEAERYVATYANEPRVDHGRILFFLRRQKYLELLESQALTPAVVELVEGLKDLERRCSNEEFATLTYALTLTRVTDHPDLADWTVHNGRLAAFASIHELLARSGGGATFARSNRAAPYSLSDEVDSNRFPSSGFRPSAMAPTVS